MHARLHGECKAAAGPEEIWATETSSPWGKKLRVLLIVDVQSFCCPAADPRFAYRSEGVVQTQEQVCRYVGDPQMIRQDRAADSSPAPHLWVCANDVTPDFFRAGNPADNGFLEAFNSKHRAEC